MATEPGHAASYVFLSYASADRPRALRIADLLEAQGITVWVDRKSIAGGTSWTSEIVRGIQGCVVLAVLCSDAAVHSKNVQQEIQLAWECDRPVLPLLLEQVELPETLRYTLAGRQWIEIDDRPDEVWLADALRALGGLGVEVRHAGAPVGTHPVAVPPGAGTAAGPGGLAPRRHNLPAIMTAFIGRERELAEVKVRLGSARLVTLTGTGGCGKSRLALQVSAGLLDDYSDGVWLVELAPLADPAVLPQTVARALGVQEDPSRSILATLLDFLRARQLLLVVDNCEHLITACAQLAEAILGVCPAVSILATSREALGLGGENAWRLPSLTLPEVPRPAVTTMTVESGLLVSEAVRLFVDRAQSAEPGFAVTARNAPAIAQICRRLDGIPLAIELAAARLKVLSVDQIAVRLDDRFRLLTGGSRTALPRQQTLRATLDWSYNLLSDPERRLLRRLSVFVSGCTLEAAEPVCGGEGVGEESVLDLLSQLVDKSLVVVDKEAGEPRYRLFETVRQYGRDRLIDSEEAATVRERHRDWFLALAERAEPELTGPRQVEWLDRLESEIDNFRAALEWSIELGPAELGLRLAGALGWLFNVRDYWSEGRDWLGRALAAPGAEPTTALRAKALDRLGFIGQLLGDMDMMRRSYEECLAICQAIGDRRRAAWAVRQLGEEALEHGEDVRAKTLFTEALGQAREIEDKWVVAQALESLGGVAGIRRDHIACRCLFAESLQLFRETGDWRAVGTSLWLAGAVAADEGDYAVARANLAEALAILRALRSNARIALVLCDLGLLTQLEGDPDRAAALADDGLAMARTIGVKWVIIYALVKRAFTARAQANAQLAQDLSGEAMTKVRVINQESAFGTLVLGLGGVLSIDRGDYSRGTRILGAATYQPRKWWTMIGERRAWDEATSFAKANLEDEAFAAAWAEGQAMTLEEAIAYAMQPAESG